MRTGDEIPDMTLLDEAHNKVSLRDFVGKPLVLYFYPMDDTPGCTAQACSFRDQFATFEDHGAVVVGVSKDSPESHLAFKQKHRLPFPLLSDQGNKLRKVFKVPSNLLGILPGRVTYIFNAEGKLVKTFNSQRNVEQHISESISVLKQLSGAS